MESELIFKNLLFSREYAAKVMPFLKEEYFQSRVEREIFKIIHNYTSSYNDFPTPDVLEFELTRLRSLGQQEYEAAKDLVSKLKQPAKTPDLKFLLDTTEEFCAHQSAYNAIAKCITIMDGDSGVPRTAIPDILRDALAVSFDTNIGHSYVDNVEERYKKLHEQTARLTTGITWLDRVFGGGIPRKTLSLLLAQSGGGKSLQKCHFAAHFFKQGYNVLYITLELSEERIGERIDANLMGVDVGDIPTIPLDTYKNKVAKIADSTKARMFIKEYPPATISSQHIRALLDEMELKQGFVPDVVFVDYINLMNSSRFKASSGANSYTILKAVAEELRAIATERNIVIISSTQMNRGAIQGSDPDMTGISDSLGLAMTADALIAIIRSDELDSLGNVMYKCLKTRFSSYTNAKSLVGINWNQMRVIDLGDASEEGIVQYPEVAEKQDEKPQPAFMRNKQQSQNKFKGITV